MFTSLEILGKTVQYSLFTMFWLIYVINVVDKKLIYYIRIFAMTFNEIMPVK